MKIAKIILVFLTAFLCLRTLILGASGMMPFLSPGMIQPQAFTDFVVSVIYSCSASAAFGILALVMIWISVKPWKGSILGILLHIAASIPLVILSYFAIGRYFRFQELADEIAIGKEIPDDIFLVLSGMSTASLTGSAVILFLMLVFQSFPKSERGAVVNASSAAGNSKNQQDD